MVPLTSYNGKEGTHYFYMLPKHAVDPLRKELVRGLRFTGKTAEFITFKLPRKESEFSADLYPPHRATIAAHSFESWAKGEDKDPVLEGFDPDRLAEQIQQKMAAAVFNKKPGAGAPKVEKPGAGGQIQEKAGMSSAAGAQEISRLNQEILQ